jgi:hypothetical protein
MRSPSLRWSFIEYLPRIGAAVARGEGRDSDSPSSVNGVLFDYDYQLTDLTCFVQTAARRDRRCANPIGYHSRFAGQIVERLTTALLCGVGVRRPCSKECAACSKLVAMVRCRHRFRRGARTILDSVRP